MPNLCPLIASREWFKENVTLRFLLIVTLEKDQEMSFERVAAISLTEISGLAIRTTTEMRRKDPLCQESKSGKEKAR
jgi:hypothetical protein